MKTGFEDQPSLINLIIQDFFDDKPRNAKGFPWFSSEEKKFLPDEMRETYSSLRKFFRKKSWHLGGKIPDELLFTRGNFHLLQNISLVESVELIYDSVEGKYEKNKDILLTLKVIRDCERKGIQQEHIGGILLLYFTLCENAEVL